MLGWGTLLQVSTQRLWCTKLNFLNTANVHWQARKNLGIPCKLFIAWEGKQPASQLPPNLFFFLMEVVTWSSPVARGLRDIKGKNRIFGGHHNLWTSPSGSGVKNPPAMQETPVWSLGREDPWKGAQQPTPGFLPGESHGQRSLVRPWGGKELDVTEHVCTREAEDNKIWVVFNILMVHLSKSGIIFLPLLCWNHIIHVLIFSSFPFLDNKTQAT